MHRSISSLLIFFSLVFLLPLHHQPVQAQTYSAYDLLNTVNEMRSSYGLPPYQVDGALMGTAQSQSDYMASIDKITHLRENGSGPESYGISAENIGGGINISPETIVYSQWADDLHTKTIIGFTEGLAGAGVTEKNGMIYYTLDVRNTGTTFNPVQATQPGVTGAQPSAESSQNDISTLQTSTPSPDGSIVHEVQAGQTLWSVANAYGVNIMELEALNPDISVDNPVIYPGQKITIRLAFTPTPSLFPSQTPVPATATPRPTFTPRPTHTITITPTPTAPGLLPRIPSLGSEDTRTLGIIVVAFCAAGLVALVIAGLRSGKKPEE